MTVPYGNINFGVVFEGAYRDALARHGLPFDPRLVFVTRRNEQAGCAIVDKMLGLDHRPTAILLIYEMTAIGLYRRLAELGLRPGTDLAVIGFRDEPTVQFLIPSLTCFSVSLHELGISVAEALLAQIPDAERYPPRIVQKLCPLVIRPGDSDEKDRRPPS